ncbi:histidine kinase [Streptomyces clavifer]|uniref:PP2C family protein-serine/threonine phosphatase n=1 Tax=Streptomyces clavifer TaxID=68188 RepID=UPI0019A0E823|nr:SpoIIE family protein phosphatase [Streptomyces clavifer]GHA81137.1 histidine kinase [Streptomyces clavifer]
MCPIGPGPDRPEGEEATSTDAAFTALLEDSAEELYESAPCGYLSTLMDGTIAKINTTLLTWLGRSRDEVVGRMRFMDLLTAGGRIYHDTHFAPLLNMQGSISGIALDLRTADGGRLPALVSSVTKTDSGGRPLLIRTTVFDAGARRSYEQELLRERRVAEEARRQVEEDRARLQEALAVLQSSLLPAALPPVPGMEAASHYHTTSPDRLGGDFYDLFPLDGTRWAFFLGDVCGKGPQAAAVTSLTRYTLRAAALHDPDPVAALTTLNTVLHERYAMGDPRYCTTVFGVLEPVGDKVKVELASGGHPPALVLRQDGRADYLPTPGGLLVGILPTAPFTSARTVLAAGDTLLLYTDGLTEARIGEKRELFGDEALRDFAKGLPHTGAQQVVTALTGLLNSFGDGLDDDTALLALGVPTNRPHPANGTPT